ncbi:hypothetical protein AGLY_010839 [Aphis glycines]|uniref:Uncharacterized protein n=1 Tax=Aphis glycines TaxID=307491 RepID=A0A6G0TGX6_APHGL|nr:hypothetical protein AGLY_010839 [Aphis glycines]
MMLWNKRKCENERVSTLCINKLTLLASGGDTKTTVNIFTLDKLLTLRPDALDRNTVLSSSGNNAARDLLEFCYHTTYIFKQKSESLPLLPSIRFARSTFTCDRKKMVTKNMCSFTEKLALVYFTLDTNSTEMDNLSDRLNLPSPHKMVLFRTTNHNTAYKKQYHRRDLVTNSKPLDLSTAMEREDNDENNNTPHISISPKVPYRQHAPWHTGSLLVGTDHSLYTGYFFNSKHILQSTLPSSTSLSAHNDERRKQCWFLRSGPKYRKHSVLLHTNSAPGPSDQPQ